ncbi:ArsR/SmtB family transcription factor [Halobacterium wangiae]|uniref:ArsR/SmtB family transcription factor n=1 Tax=Halobacterium wangiae TaxID=2902623 RepID=UPI001E475EFB|nr:helix-turn-helix domain-containing protein [Halobacterium wangiae]
MSDVLPPEDALVLLGDEYARRILVATRTEPMTASTLADTIDAAPSTVYERIGDLERAGFLTEVTRTDDHGNHYAEYSARLEQLSVRVTADGLELDAAYADRDEAAERLRALWRDVR